MDTERRRVNLPALGVSVWRAASAATHPRPTPPPNIGPPPALWAAPGLLRLLAGQRGARLGERVAHGDGAGLDGRGGVADGGVIGQAADGRA